MPKIDTKNIRNKVVIMPQCAVPLCRAKKSPYHPFPKEDEQLFQIWKSCISNNRFRLVTDEEIRLKFSICDDHFAKSCKIPGTQTLKKYSIPTLNVQGFKNNSNINVAYKLYIEKQEKDPDNISVKNIMDHNIDDNCIFIDSSSKTKSNIIWVESHIESEIQDLPPLENIIDPLITDSDIQNELINDSDTCKINNINMKKDIKKKKNHHLRTASIINEEVIPVIKNVINKYSGPNKVIRKPIKSNQSGLKSHIKCSVPNCENRYGSFHKFPTDPELSKTWKNVLGITGPIKDHMKICSNHFKSSDYFVQFVYGPVKLENEKFKCSRMNLKKTAIPFKNTSDKSQKKIICAAYNCYNNNIDHKKMRFFPFPKNEKMAQIWATNANREDLLLRQNYFEKIYLCSNHFEKRCLRKSDIDIIPTIFNDADCSYKPNELYSNLFMRTNIETQKRFKNHSISSKFDATMKNSLQIFINDPDKSKITYAYDEIVNESCVSSDFGKMDSSNCLYEDFVSNPGILDFKPQTTDLLFKKNYCRLCAKLCSVASLISIFDKSGNLTMYGEMIEICLPGKVDKNDNLPQWMCSKCEYKLDVCCSSIKDFIDADNQLRNIFKVDKECNQKSKHEEITNLVDLTEDPIEILENLKSPTSEISIESELKEHLKIDSEDVSPPNIPPEINKIIQVEQNKKYQCLKCNQLFDTKKELIQHSLESHNTDLSKTNIVCEIVSGDRNSIIENNKAPLTTTKVKCSKLRYECVICSSLHEKKDSLIKHSLRYHSSTSSSSKRIVCRVVQLSNLRNNHLTCLHCTEQFINIAKYRKHMKHHLKLNCNICGKQFTRKYKLIAHARLHDAKSFSCAKCSQFFTDEMDLVKHEVAAHKKLKSDIIKCSFCEEEFKTSGELLKHKKTHAKSLCNICGKLFSSSTLLKYHLEKHTDGQPHTCSICSKTFQTMLSLKRHQTIHSTEKRFICQVCGKQFGYLSVLKSHMFSHSTHRPYICELCGAAFHRRNNLKKHISTHEKIKDKSITCAICKLEFNSRKMFMRHREEHVIDKKTFSCDICSKDFFTKFQAKVHRRVHTGETPYNCEQCGKSFRSLALVKQHKLIHMNVFPHQCNYCDRKFRRLQSLIVHRRTHTGEKPYPCPICGRAFANRSDMNKHRRNIHIFKNKRKSNQIEPDNQLNIENIFDEIQDEMYSTENNYMQEVQEDNSCSNNILTSLLHV